MVSLSILEVINDSRCYAGAEVHTYVGHTAEVIALQFDQNDCQSLVTGSFDGAISLWDTRVKE